MAVGSKTSRDPWLVKRCLHRAYVNRLTKLNSNSIANTWYTSCDFQEVKKLLYIGCPQLVEGIDYEAMGLKWYRGLVMPLTYYPRMDDGNNPNRLTTISRSVPHAEHRIPPAGHGTPPADHGTPPTNHGIPPADHEIPIPPPSPNKSYILPPPTPSTKGKEKEKDGRNLGGLLMDLAEDGSENGTSTGTEKGTSTGPPLPTENDAGTTLPTPTEKQTGTTPSAPAG